MTTETASKIAPNPLPEAARNRIEQLRILFIVRCRDNAEMIRARLEENVHRDDPQSFRAEVIPVLHSLVGTGGIFGYRELSEATAATKRLLRQSEGFSEEWIPALNTVLAHLDALSED